jgi:hypothetical protein
VPQHIRTSQQKLTAKLAYKPAFFRADLHFATETSLVRNAGLVERQSPPAAIPTRGAFKVPLDHYLCADRN